MQSRASRPLALVLLFALALPCSPLRAQGPTAALGSLLSAALYTERDADRIRDSLRAEALSEVARVWPAEPARESALRQFVAQRLARSLPQSRAPAADSGEPRTLAQKLEYLLFFQLQREPLRDWVGRASELAAALERMGHDDARARLLRADLGGAEQSLSAVRDELSRRRLGPLERTCQTVLDAAAIDVALGQINWLQSDLAHAAHHYRAAIRALRGPACGDSNAARERRAASLVDLALVYGELARGREAHGALRVSTLLYRGLADRQPAAFRDPLAMALTRFAQACESLQREDEARTALVDAVELDRGAERAGDPSVKSRLARNLQALAAHEVLHRRDAFAWQHQDAAVSLWRELDRSDPGHHAAALASALADRSASEVRSSRMQAAGHTLEEALSIRTRLLADASPDLVLPQLAQDLGALAAVYQASSRLEDALRTIKHALGLLELMREELCLPQYANSLWLLGNVYGALGRYPEALQATARSVELIRRSQLRPDGASQLPGLAMALTILGAVYAQLQRPEDALRATEEAVGLYRGLAQTGEERSLPDYAMSLRNLARVLRSARPRETTIAPLEELVTLYRKLAQAQLGFMPELAAALGSLAVAYNDLGRKSDALLAVRQAHALYRQLVPDQPNLRPGLEQSKQLLEQLSPQ